MKHWSVGEVELIAAYTSRNNECQFCYKDHIAVAGVVYEEPFIQAVIDAPESAGIDDKMKVTLTFIKKLTVSPSELSKEDVAPLKAVGLSNEAIEEAIQVAVFFV